jgi:hypothetical protein
MGNFNTSAF